MFPFHRCLIWCSAFYELLKNVNNVSKNKKRGCRGVCQIIGQYDSWKRWEKGWICYWRSVPLTVTIFEAMLSGKLFPWQSESKWEQIEGLHQRMGLSCVCLGDIHLRMAGAFLEYRNSFSKHRVTDCASHLDYIKTNFYVNAYSFHPGFKFQLGTITSGSHRLLVHSKWDNTQNVTEKKNKAVI